MKPFTNLFDHGLWTHFPVESDVLHLSDRYKHYLGRNGKSIQPTGLLLLFACSPALFVVSSPVSFGRFFTRLFGRFFTRLFFFSHSRQTWLRTLFSPAAFYFPHSVSTIQLVDLPNVIPQVSRCGRNLMSWFHPLIFQAPFLPLLLISTRRQPRCSSWRRKEKGI